MHSQIGKRYKQGSENTITEKTVMMRTKKNACHDKVDKTRCNYVVTIFVATNELMMGH